MKILKVTTYVMDFDGDDVDDIIYRIENSVELGYVKKVESVEVNDWTDDHPMNQMNTDCDQWWIENYPRMDVMKNQLNCDRFDRYEDRNFIATDDEYPVCPCKHWILKTSITR